MFSNVITILFIVVPITVPKVIYNFERTAYPRLYILKTFLKTMIVLSFFTYYCAKINLHFAKINFVIECSILHNCTIHDNKLHNWSSDSQSITIYDERCVLAIRNLLRLLTVTLFFYNFDVS